MKLLVQLLSLQFISTEVLPSLPCTGMLGARCVEWFDGCHTCPCDLKSRTVITSKCVLAAHFGGRPENAGLGPDDRPYNKAAAGLLSAGIYIPTTPAPTPCKLMGYSAFAPTPKPRIFSPNQLSNSQKWRKHETDTGHCVKFEDTNSAAAKMNAIDRLVGVAPPVGEGPGQEKEQLEKETQAWAEKQVRLAKSTRDAAPSRFSMIGKPPPAVGAAPRAGPALPKQSLSALTSKVKPYKKIIYGEKEISLHMIFMFFLVIYTELPKGWHFAAHA